MKFNYTELTNRIWEFNESGSLGLSALSVYFYLLKIGFERGYCKFSVSDSQMSRELKMTRKTVKVCKEKLRHFGIICYQSRNGVPSDFQLNTDYPIIFNDALNEMKIDLKPLTFKKTRDLPIESAPNKAQPELKTKQSTIQNERINDIPTLEEFLKHAKSLDSYNDHLIFEVKIKYDNWISNGWKNNFDRPITNWKSALKNAIPYLKNDVQDNQKLNPKIPNITRVNIDNGKT
jgi:hypothetical protein